MSAQHSESVSVDALDSGANDFVTKPMRRGELLARIRMHLRMQRTPPSAHGGGGRSDGAQLTFGGGANDSEGDGIPEGDAEQEEADRQPPPVVGVPEVEDSSVAAESPHSSGRFRPSLGSVGPLPGLHPSRASSGNGVSLAPWGSDVHRTSNYQMHVLPRASLDFFHDYDSGSHALPHGGARPSRHDAPALPSIRAGSESGSGHDRRANAAPELSLETAPADTADGRVDALISVDVQMRVLREELALMRQQLTVVHERQQQQMLPEGAEVREGEGHGVSSSRQRAEGRGGGLGARTMSWLAATLDMGSAPTSAASSSHQVARSPSAPLSGSGDSSGPESVGVEGPAGPSFTGAQSGEVQRTEKKAKKRSFVRGIFSKLGSKKPELAEHQPHG